MTRDDAIRQVYPYDWTVDEFGRLVRPDGRTIQSVRLTTVNKGRRWQVRAVDGGRLLWSGPDLGRFLADFYCARRVAP